MSNDFDIEKEIYNTQWTNIRHHWDETIKSIRYLSTLIVFAIIPLKFIRVTSGDAIQYGVDEQILWYIKLAVMSIIFLLGLLTLLSQHNHYKRSKEARKVVVEIEKKWGLYDSKGHFVYQDKGSDYQYGKFAGGESRLSHSQIQFGYIIVITTVGMGFVCFA